MLGLERSPCEGSLQIFKGLAYIEKITHFVYIALLDPRNRSYSTVGIILLHEKRENRLKEETANEMEKKRHFC